MSDYTQTTDFSVKDSLPSGDPSKIIKGSDFDTEFTAIATAISTKLQDTYTAAVSGAVATTITGTLSENLSLENFGVTGDGVADDTTKIDSAYGVAAAGKTMMVPAGSYLYDGTVYEVESDSYSILKNVTGFTPNMAYDARRSPLTVSVETSNNATYSADLDRYGITCNVRSYGDQLGIGFASYAFNNSTNDTGAVGSFNYANSVLGSCVWTAGVHSEVMHGGGTTIGLSIEVATFNDTGSPFGIVVHDITGLRANNDVSNDPAEQNTATTAVFVMAQDPATVPLSGFKYGLRFDYNSIRAGGTTIKIDCDATVEQHFKTEANTNSSIADIVLEGSSGTGLICLGNYSTGNAIRISSGDAISLEETGAHKILSGTGSPEGAVTAAIGSLYCRLDGGANTTLYVKQSGAGNTGWAAK